MFSFDFGAVDFEHGFIVADYLVCYWVRKVVKNLVTWIVICLSFLGSVTTKSTRDERRPWGRFEGWSLRFRKIIDIKADILLLPFVNGCPLAIPTRRCAVVAAMSSLILSSFSLMELRILSSLSRLCLLRGGSGSRPFSLLMELYRS